MQVLSLLAYRLVLDLVYVKAISPLYSYKNFTADLYLPRYLLSLACMLLIAPAVAALFRDKRASSMLLLCISCIYFIPFTSYCGCRSGSMFFLFCGMLYWILLLLWQRVIPSPQLLPLFTKHSDLVFSFLSVLGTLLVLLISAKYTHFRLVFDFINVYEVRAEAASYALLGAVRYLLSAMTVLLSVCILFWLKKKKYLIALLLLCVYYLFFSISANKSVFFFLFLLLACWFLYRDWMLQSFSVLLSAAVLAAWAICKKGIVIPLSFFVRRMMYLPVQISEKCSVFFLDHPLNLFRDGFLGHFGFNAVYSDSMPRIVGEISNEVTNANNGLLGDMFSNLPVPIGLLLMPLLLVLCFRLLDLTTNGLPQKLIASFCVFFAVSFINSSWSAVLLTHGFLLCCILLLIFPRGGELREHDSDCI